MTTRKVKAPKPRPLGKNEVVVAVLSAARKLFAERGYAAVSVRDIAAAANINHGLIHRHFGSKDRILHAVLQGMFSDVSGLVRANLDLKSPDFIDRLYPLAAARKQDWQILMRAVLDGFDFQVAGFEFPLTGLTLDHVAARRGARDMEARTIAGTIIAGGLGWLLLEPYLGPILQLDGVDPSKTRARVAALLKTLIDS